MGSGAGLKVKTRCAEWWGLTGLYWEKRQHVSGREGLWFKGHENCSFITKMLFIKYLSCSHVFYDVVSWGFFDVAGFGLYCIKA